MQFTTRIYYHILSMAPALLGAQLAACNADPPVEVDDPGASSLSTTAPSPGTTAPNHPTGEGGQDATGGGASSSDDSSGDDSSGDDDSSGGGGDDGVSPPPDDDADDINAFILGLGHLAVDPPVPAEQIECIEDDCLQDGPKGDYTCDYTHYTVTENYSEFVAFAPNSATLWPGSIVEGADAEAGLLTAIGLPRTPLTFSVSLPLQGGSVGHLDAPTLSSYRDKLYAMLATGLQGGTPANFSFELRQVFSESELSLALGTSVKWPGGSEISSMFSTNNQQTKTQVVANFVQTYFTVDMDTPLQPADLFADSVSVAQLGAFMGVDNPPMYVQSVTYGRRAVFSIESSQTVEDVHAALGAAIQAVVDGEAEIAYKHKKLLNESTMQVFVLGGSADDGIHAVDGFLGLMDYIKGDAEFSADSPGAAIGYKLAYLDNYGTQFAFTTEFAEADCSYTPDKLRVSLDNIHFHKNGCDGWDNSCKQTYKIWVETPGGKQTIASQLTPQFIDDGQTVGLGVVKDFVLPDADSSWLTIGFSADEDGLSVQTTKKFEYDGGWQNLGDHGITAKTPANADEDLDVTLWFEVEEL